MLGMSIKVDKFDLSPLSTLLIFHKLTVPTIYFSLLRLELLSEFKISSMTACCALVAPKAHLRKSAVQNVDSRSVRRPCRARLALVDVNAL